VATLQYERGLLETGELDAATWQELLPAGPAAVRWSARRRGARAAGSARTMPEPLNAGEPARRNELARGARG
jgi:hypothetical protein